ncbi:T3SS effector HopA1 family protein [Kribbella catacumbae]|uniref:T3SS effector HopA1 family protein n=1 Tax=Kribbella catacumbae TaxID=460086 RepID=UPI000368916E|nr:T3SS effector HopA1 family protein [Kribbella catacumbae]
MSARTASAENLNAGLAEAIDQIEVTTDPWHARVDDRILSADSDRQLVGELADAMYDVLHAGRRSTEGPQPKSVRDARFEQLLLDQVPHSFIWMDQIAVEVSGTRGIVVAMDGLRVLVPPDALAGASPAQVGERVRFRVPATRPAASPGFLLVQGESGTLDPRQGILRIYLHLPAADAAPAAWGAVLQALNDLKVPYQAKASSAPRFYPRRDALVVYLDSAALQMIASLPTVLTSLQLAPEVSVFAAPLAPGMAWAWEPDDRRPGNVGLSLGQHRSRAVAEALVAHAAGKADPDRYQAVRNALRAANIDPYQPHRNLGSPA